MKRILALCSAVCLVLILSRASFAQPGGPPPDRQQRGPEPTVDSLVARMMKFDTKGEGKLTREMITDPRLVRLFDQADANHDGVVTKEELTDLAKKLIADNGSSRGNDRGFGGPPGFGDPRGGPPGQNNFRGGPQGPGDSRSGPPGGFGPPPPEPGKILSGRIRDDLQLDSKQQAQLDELQKLVDERLEKILNDRQKRMLEDFKQRGPGRDGPPPGP